MGVVVDEVSMGGTLFANPLSMAAASSSRSRRPTAPRHATRTIQTSVPWQASSWPTAESAVGLVARPTVPVAHTSEDVGRYIAIFGEFLDVVV